MRIFVKTVQEDQGFESLVFLSFINQVQMKCYTTLKTRKIPQHQRVRGIRQSDIILLAYADARWEPYRQYRQNCHQIFSDGQWSQ